VRPLHLSKSRFTTGLQCHKLLWWRVHDRDAPEMVVAPEQQAVFDIGHLVGARACAEFPGGVLVEAPHDDFDARVARTRAAIESGAPAIFEASFIEDDIFVAVDVLERTERGWVLVEVKSTTKVKSQHLPDAAIQAHVLRRAGLTIERIELMHLNRECRYPDLSNLFTRADITAELDDILNLGRTAAAQLEMLTGILPDVRPGAQCYKPYTCPFLERCWERAPEHHVSTLYRIGGKAAQLEAQGYTTILDLPDDVELSWVADRQRRAVKAGRLIVEPTLRDALADVHSPYAVLDFEAIQPAIPMWDGCRPYDQVPAQFSCDVVSASGAIAHHEWLADGPGDPRPEIAARVVAACHGVERVFAYNAMFEALVLRELADAVPEHAAALGGIEARLIDALPLVRDHVYHPAFGGSFGLKAVLPALVPGMDYDDFEVAGGRAATIELARLMFERDTRPDEERERTRSALLRYCAQDTLGVVRLLERLTALAAA
jgi:hypothetical protein